STSSTSWNTSRVGIALLPFHSLTCAVVGGQGRSLSQPGGLLSGRRQREHAAAARTCSVSCPQPFAKPPYARGRYRPGRHPVRMDEQVAAVRSPCHPWAWSTILINFPQLRIPRFQDRDATL